MNNDHHAHVLCYYNNQLNAISQKAKKSIEGMGDGDFRHKDRGCKPKKWVLVPKK